MREDLLVRTVGTTTKEVEIMAGEGAGTVGLQKARKWKLFFFVNSIL